MDLKNNYTEFIKLKSKELGFMSCGISKSGFLSDEAYRFESWLKNNYHGKMSYMERNFDKRLDTTKLVENSKSVISLTYNYYPKKVLKSDSTFKISKYAYGKDYHVVLKRKLKQLLNIMKEKFGFFEGRVFVDSAPILERAWAKKSGLGWIGKNTNLINKQSGSFFFLAEIIVDLELNYDNTTTDHCGSCTACIDACPTNAIYEPYKLDASRCISYYTIELKESFSSNLSSDFKDWIFGCDICQDVCPWNRFSKANDEVLFETIPEISNFNKVDWIDLSEETFKKVFKESPIKRSKFKGLKRNINYVR
ncbi:tRNA epoxyqueuosine(34) reductase QueG [Flavobacteriales bacterium]|nr:tRNA epoxyqueuosine(34) reductase QueG [Flavobacteriales bacterium]